MNGLPCAALAHLHVAHLHVRNLARRFDGFDQKKIPMAFPDEAQHFQRGELHAVNQIPEFYVQPSSKTC
jgi:hypothetical protein